MGIPEGESSQPAEQVGVLWHWRRGDLLPPLEPRLAKWRISRFSPGEADDTLIALLASTLDLPSQRSRRRFKRGHHVVIGFLDDQPVAYGWVAIESAIFGEPAVTFHIPPEGAYLYDFVTVEAWRGRGCYPTLLQYSIETESASDFWIIHHIDNIASQHGIARAGFHRACAIYRTTIGQLVLTPDADPDRAEVGSALLGLPLLSSS